jgi:hypothetical protein
MPIVDVGLARSDVEALADLEDAIGHLRAALADAGGPDAVPKSS